MGSVKVRYIGLIQNVIGNRQEILPISSDTTVRKLLETLSEKYGAQFRHSVLRSSGELRISVTIHVDDRNIKESGGLETPLKSNSEVTVIITGHPDPGG